jgi:hypothetical protein
MLNRLAIVARAVLAASASRAAIAQARESRQAIVPSLLCDHQYARRRGEQRGVAVCEADKLKAER